MNLLLTYSIQNVKICLYFTRKIINSRRKAYLCGLFLIGARSFPLDQDSNLWTLAITERWYTYQE